MNPQCFKNKDGVWEKNSKVWIPDELLTRIIIHNHHVGGHLAVEGEMARLKSYYTYDRIDKKVRQFIRDIHRTCLHCDHSPKLRKSPIGAIPHGKKPGEVFHLDYLNVEGNYILVMIEDFSRKVILKYRESCDAVGAIEAIFDWKANFGLKKKFVICTDQGSHFCHRMWQELERFFKFKHRFSILYSAWTNGSVEVSNQFILRRLQSTMSQYGLDVTEWPSILKVVQGFINNYPNYRMGNLSPNEILLG